MSRLITHLKNARARHRAHREHGAIAVLVALSMVVILGFVALAIDAGAMYEERAELQSAADAAALAVAQECASGGDCTVAGNMELAKQYAAANMRDGSVKVESLSIVGAQVKVHVLTAGADGSNQLSLTFAPAIGVENPVIGAHATATWMFPLSGPAALPVIFSRCEFKFSDDPQVLVMKGAGDTTKNASTAGAQLQIKSGLHRGPAPVFTTASSRTTTTGDVMVPVSAVTIPTGVGTPPPTPVVEGCENYTTSTGHVLPGGFKQIDDGQPGRTSQCAVMATVYEWASAETGASLDNRCEQVLRDNIGKTVLLPIYDDLRGQGDKGEYRVAGWAAFEVLGYNFPGFTPVNDKAYPGAECSKANKCTGLIGRFKQFASLNPEGFTGGGPNYGAAIISLKD